MADSATATVRIIDASGGAVASASGVSLAQAGDSFTLKGGPVADRLFSAWHPTFKVEITVRDARGRNQQWLCDAPAIGADSTQFDGRKVAK